MLRANAFVVKGKMLHDAFHGVFTVIAGPRLTVKVRVPRGDAVPAFMNGGQVVISVSEDPESRECIQRYIGDVGPRYPWQSIGEEEFRIRGRMLFEPHLMEFWLHGEDGREVRIQIDKGDSFPRYMDGGYVIISIRPDRGMKQEAMASTQQGPAVLV